MSKMKLLMGATALVAASAAFTGASATTNLNAAGSSLVAPYLVQAFTCYGNSSLLVIKGSALNNPTYANPAVPVFNYTGAKAQNCASSHVDTTVQGTYVSTGSGTGLKAFISHNPAAYVGDTVPGTDPSTYSGYTFTGSETAFDAADVTAYNTGGSDHTTGISLGATPAPYPVPAPLYGPMVQVPLTIDPVALAYSSEYGRYLASDGTTHHYHFQLHKPRTTDAGGLILDAATYCEIFNGHITDWNQIPSSLNGNHSLRDPQDLADHPGTTFSVPLVLVGRSDSSGTTSMFTRHMAAQCPSVITDGVVYADSTSTIPSSLAPASLAWTKTNLNFGPSAGVTPVAGKMVTASGSDGVADYINFDSTNVPTTTGSEVLQGRIGYVGPDFVMPSVVNTGDNSFGLVSASLLRPGATAAIAPTAAAAALAYGSLTPPTGSNVSQPNLWVQLSSKSASIAVPSNIKAYPIVGTSNFVGYTCYADAAVANAIQKFFVWYWSSTTMIDTKLGMLAKAGLAPLPVSWRTAIKAEFIFPTTASKADNLYITYAGNPTASQCTSVTPGA